MKLSSTVFSNNLQYIIYVNKNAEKKLFSFLASIKSLYCISSMYELLINNISFFQLFYHMYES